MFFDLVRVAFIAELITKRTRVRRNEDAQIFEAGLKNDFCILINWNKNDLIRQTHYGRNGKGYH